MTVMLGIALLPYQSQTTGGKTQVSTNTENTVSELDRFLDRCDTENDKRSIRKAWFISVYQATDGKVDLPWSVDYSTEYVTQYAPRPTKLVEKSWDPGKYYEQEDYDAPQEIDVDA